MRKMSLLIVVALLVMFNQAGAVPDLQLLVAGGEYDMTTETWVISASSFDLYVVGANKAMSDVMISMALNVPISEDPNGTVSIDINGTAYDDWIFGTPDLLPPHGVYPTWYNEFNSGNYGLVGGVGNVNYPEYYDPSVQGYLTSSSTLGEFRRFHVAVSGTDFAHFDAFFYFQGQSGATKIKFAPFSHDAESQGAVPEPTTLALFGLGTLGVGLARRFRH